MLQKTDVIPGIVNVDLDSYDDEGDLTPKFTRFVLHQYGGRFNLKETLPDDGHARNLVIGELVQKLTPSPNSVKSYTQTKLWLKLCFGAAAHNGEVFRFDMNIRLGREAMSDRNYGPLRMFDIGIGRYFALQSVGVHALSQTLSPKPDDRHKIKIYALGGNNLHSPVNTVLTLEAE